jgi:hypothetical protein
LWFLLPALIELISGREVSQTRYSSGILAVLHSTQYLCITSYYQKKEARAQGHLSRSFPRYLLTLVAGASLYSCRTVDCQPRVSRRLRF